MFWGGRDPKDHRVQLWRELPIQESNITFVFLAAGSNQLRQYQRPETLFSQSPTGKCYPQKHFLRLGSKELLFSQCSAKAKRALLNKECRISLRSGEWEFSPGLCVIQAGLISSVPNYQFVKHLGVRVLIMQGCADWGVWGVRLSPSSLGLQSLRCCSAQTQTQPLTRGETSGGQSRQMK